jgi:uncharacterized protein GlcG (DUF336 family)
MLRAMLGLVLMTAAVGAAQAQPAAGGPPPPGPSPTAPPPSITVEDARAIIDGAIAYARERNVRMGITVLDSAGDIVIAQRMEGAAGRNVKFAEAKAHASLLYRTTTEALSQLYKTRPDRYFGIMNMYGNKVYLVGGGVPLAVDGKLVGAVGVAGLAEFEDERAGRAGIAAWEKMRASKR